MESFGASSPRGMSPTPTSAPMTGPPSAVESDFLRGLLVECEHCTYTPVFSRDENANRFWQDAGPLWTH